VLDVVISAEVAGMLQTMRSLRRRLVSSALEQLGRPRDFAAMRPLVGRKHWFTTDIGPYVVTIDHRDMLGAAAQRLMPPD